MNKEGLTRAKLKEKLPLEAPLAVQAHITNKCNLRCCFCAHALDGEAFKSLKSFDENMPLETFKKFVEQAKDFPQKFKTINLAGIGEPLLHPDIVEMTRLAKEANIAERIEIVTNAVLLTPAMADKLIDAGVDRLRISINGLNDEDYHKYCSIKKNGIFNKIVDNIAYFKEHRKDSALYIKIMDFMADTEEKLEFFDKTFKPLADFLNVECCAPFYKGVDYSFHKGMAKGVRGNELIEAKVCSMSFYTMTLTADGSIYPCCNYPYPIILGNINKTPVLEIYRGGYIEPSCAVC